MHNEYRLEKNEELNGNSKYQLRHAAGMYWLLTMNQRGQDYINPVAFNEAGALIWSLWERGEPKRAIALQLHQKYGISQEEALSDITCFLQELEQKGIKIGE